MSITLERQCSCMYYLLVLQHAALQGRPCPSDPIVIVDQ